MREDVILNEIANYLEEWLGFADPEREGSLDMAAIHHTLKPSDLPEAFEQVRKLVCPPAPPKQDIKRLERRAATLRANVKRGRRNLALLSARNIPDAEEQIREWETELQAVETDIKACTPPPEKDINRIVLDVLTNLYALANYCRNLSRPAGQDEGNAPTLRRFFNGASHIVVHTTKTGKGKGTRHTLARGEIVFKTVGVMAGKVNPRPLGPEPSALPG